MIKRILLVSMSLVLTAGLFMSCTAFAGANPEGIQTVDSLFREVSGVKFGDLSGAADVCKAEIEAIEEQRRLEEEAKKPRKIYVGDYWVMSNASVVDLSGMDLSSYDMMAFMDSMTDLRKLNLKGTGLENKDYAKLQDTHPDVRILWDIKTRYWTIPTDTVAFSTLIGYNDNRRLYNEDAYYFRYCTDMVALDIGHNYVTDLSFLEYMPNLKILILVENYDLENGGRLKDITPIKYCTKLRYLEFFANDVRDFSSLRYLKELEDLNFCYNRVDNIEDLKDFPKLQKLWMYGTRIPRDQVQELKEIYPDVWFCTSGSGSVDQGWRSGEHFRAMRNMVKNNVIDDVYKD